MRGEIEWWRLKNEVKGWTKSMVHISSKKYLGFKIISQGRHAHSEYGNKFVKLVKVKEYQRLRRGHIQINGSLEEIWTKKWPLTLIQIQCHRVLSNKIVLNLKYHIGLKQFFNINLGIAIIKKNYFLFVFSTYLPVFLLKIRLESLSDAD